LLLLRTGVEEEDAMVPWMMCVCCCCCHWARRWNSLPKKCEPAQQQRTFC